MASYATDSTKLPHSHVVFFHAVYSRLYMGYYPIQLSGVCHMLKKKFIFNGLPKESDLLFVTMLHPTTLTAYTACLDRSDASAGFGTCCKIYCLPIE